MSGTRASEGSHSATVETGRGARPGGAYTGADVALGRYALGRRLGSGGFGTVYEGRDLRLGRDVAVKVIDGAASSPQRARREAMAAARLDHPGIVAVFDAGEEGTTRYLVSELVRGRTLAELEAQGALSVRDVLRIGLALADALRHAHDRGVVHRDVKPHNVIVPEPADGVPRPGHDSWRAAAKLADFGVASLAGDEPLTQTGDIVGTLAYMAPEQAAGERVDELADVYALALVLYEALAGVHPVRAGSPAATARRVGTVLPSLRRRRGDLPDEVCAAIDAALDPDPDARGDLDDLAEALASALPEVSDQGGTIAPHPLERERRPLPPGVERVLAALGAGAMAGLVLLALAPGEPPPAPLVAGIAFVTAVMPRLGWLAGAAALLLFLPAAGDPGVGAVLLLAAVLAASPLLLRRSPVAWSLPALAPVLGLLAAATAFVAVAGRARSVVVRAALGAVGALWLMLAEMLTARVLLLGPPPGAELVTGSSLSASEALRLAGDGLLRPGAGGLILLWGLGAAVLPWLVRGRSAAADIAAAVVWAAALAGATAFLAVSNAGEGGDRLLTEPRGLMAGALAAAALAAWRRR